MEKYYLISNKMEIKTEAIGSVLIAYAIYTFLNFMFDNMFKTSPLMKVLITIAIVFFFVKFVF